MVGAVVMGVASVKWVAMGANKRRRIYDLVCREWGRWCG